MAIGNGLAGSSSSDTSSTLKLDDRTGPKSKGESTVGRLDFREEVDSLLCPESMYEVEDDCEAAVREEDVHDVEVVVEADADMENVPEKDQDALAMVAAEPVEVMEMPWL